MGWCVMAGLMMATPPLGVLVVASVHLRNAQTWEWIRFIDLCFFWLVGCWPIFCTQRPFIWILRCDWIEFVAASLEGLMGSQRSVAVCKAPLSLQAEGWYFEVEAPPVFPFGASWPWRSLVLSWQDFGPHERQQARCSEDFIDRGSSCYCCYCCYCV